MGLLPPGALSPAPRCPALLGLSHLRVTVVMVIQ